MTRAEIREQVLRELAAVADDDLTVHANDGINFIRRQIQNIKGGKLKFLRAYQDIEVGAGDQFSTLSSDTHVIRIVWNMTDDCQVPFLDEDEYRGKYGEQDGSTGDLVGYLLDAPRSSGFKQIEWVAPPASAKSIRMRYWKLLQVLTDDEDDDEITDIPEEHIDALITGVRWYLAGRVPKASDMIGNAWKDWMAAKAEIARTEEDTSERSIRPVTGAEIDRVGHRKTLNFDTGTY